MLPAYLQALLTAAQLLSATVTTATDTAPLSFLPPTCGPALSAAQSVLPLPASVTGRVRFYAALYDSQTHLPVRALALGPTNQLQPLASTFKPLVVQAALQDVDAGRFTLAARFLTTSANRSIESYPPGRNTLQTLARRAIYNSDNTASDILQLAHGPLRLAAEVHSLSPCTSLLLTTKAWWTAQAGLARGVLGDDLLAGARAYGRLPFEQRLDGAQQLIQAAGLVNAPVLEAALDTYFRGPTYTPDLELGLQNTSTVSAFADLTARTLTGDALKPGTRRLFRQLLSTGCCQPKKPLLRATYWAAKAGTGWRILNLTGSVETAGGQTLAYAYFNDQSDTEDSVDMERQIGAVVKWIEANLLTLTGTG
jgi:beta-lactamase class A